VVDLLFNEANEQLQNFIRDILCVKDLLQVICRNTGLCRHLVRLLRSGQALLDANMAGVSEHAFGALVMGKPFDCFSEVVVLLGKGRAVGQSFLLLFNRVFDMVVGLDIRFIVEDFLLAHLLCREVRLHWG